MVDNTSSVNLVNQDIVAVEHRSRIKGAAEKWWSNMIAVIKLRQTGTTMVSKLPKGVFRHMLEYKIPNELSFRYSDSTASIRGFGQKRHFPATDKLSYNNYLVSVDEM